MFDCTKRQSSHHENIANICPALMNWAEHTKRNVQFQSETVVGERHSGKINGAAGNSERAIEKVHLFSPHYSY